jgi:hypothetical protein
LFDIDLMCGGVSIHALLPQVGLSTNIGSSPKSKPLCGQRQSLLEYHGYRNYTTAVFLSMTETASSRRWV